MDEKGKKVHEVPVPNNARSFDLSADGKTVAVWLETGCVLLTALDGKRKLASPRGHLAPVVAAGLEAKGSVLTVDADGLVLRWSPSRKGEFKRVMKLSKPVYKVLFLPDGKLLAATTASEPGTVARYKLGESKPEAEWTLHKRFTTTLALFPGRPAALAGGEDGGVHALPYNGTSEDKVREYFPSGKIPWRAVHVAASSALRAVYVIHNNNGAARAFDAETGKDRGAIHIPGVRFKRVACSPVEGKIAIASSEGAVWTVDQGREPVLLAKADGAEVCALAFSDDGQLLFAGSNRLRCWEAASRRPLFSLHRLEGSGGDFSGTPNPGSPFLTGGGVCWVIEPALPRRRLGREEVARLWTRLASPSPLEGRGAAAELARGPEAALAHIARALKVPGLSRKEMLRRVADLDSDEGTAREAAYRALAENGPAGLRLLAEALPAAKSAERRRSLGRLLDELSRRPHPAEGLRFLRALRVLEAVGGPKALRILASLRAAAPEGSPYLPYLDQCLRAIRAKAKRPE